MERLSVYLPRDRLLSLVTGREIPTRASGAVVFADISGFTPLTEEFTRTLGPSRGAEELTRLLNRIYEELVLAVDRYHGSVIDFAGDSMTCWFEGDDGRKATAAAFGMQRSMNIFAATPAGQVGTVELSIKVGIAAGTTLRFTVGDPEIQLIDVLAGQTLVRMAGAQSMARQREILLDEATALALGRIIEITEWRSEAEAGARFAVANRLARPVPPDPWPLVDTQAVINQNRLKDWVLSPVYERLVANRGDFLTELRPAIAMFISFSGIDYELDPAAGQKLDAYVRWVQQTLNAYGGFLINFTIGDKGSYFHACFGAPLSHENDLWRALTAGLVLRTPGTGLEYIRSVQIGISSGTMRCGSYGGGPRRTYGVQGDETNLAARLMQHAGPAEVLVSGRVRNRAGESFRFEAMEPVRLKGKRDPVPVFRLLAATQKMPLRLSEPTYALPMIGRRRELEQLLACLDAAMTGGGRLVGVTGEAGMGKSRLLAELVREVNARGTTGFSGHCSSFGVSSSYGVWQPVWAQFFGLNKEAPAEAQLQDLEAALGRIDPRLAGRLPLLGAVTELSIPDNELTRTFDPKLRKTSLEALLVDCLRQRARQEPLLIILEDAHWIDPLSVDLLRALGAAIGDLPVLIVLSYRPPTDGHVALSGVRSFPNYLEIQLAEFTHAESEALIAAKAEHLSHPGHSLPPAVIERLVAWADGNPFYLEELLNYAHDRRGGLDDLQQLESLEVPGSLQSLILSRIDQLSESQKGTLKVASVVGRVFRAPFLWGAYPELGSSAAVRTDLAALQSVELTALEREQPELIYFFKHALTQEAAYESLPSDTRALIHERVGNFIEIACAAEIDSLIDVLAFHYLHSNNVDKQREYLLRAGQAAQARYANQAAIDYYRRLLPLLTGHDQLGVQLQLGQVLELSGDWVEAERVYQSALVGATQRGERQPIARSQAAIGELLRKQARYGEALDWLELAREGFVELADRAGEAQALHHQGNLAAQQGQTAQANDLYLRSLEIRRWQDDQPKIARLLSNLGILAHQYTQEPAKARELYEESLQIRRQLNDRWAIANSLNNLGVLLYDQGELERARDLLEESVALNRQVGDRWAISNALTSVADVALKQGDFPVARRCLEESLQISRELEEPRAIAFLLECFGRLAASTDRPDRAVALFAAAAALRDRIGAPLSPAEIPSHERLLAAVRSRLDQADRDRLEAEGSALTVEASINFALAH